MGYLIYLLSAYWLPFIGLYKWFEKAGQPGWAALVPFYNVHVALKIIGSPQWRLILTLIPLVHVFIIAGILIDLNRSFGRYSFWDNAAVIILPYVFHLYWAKKVEYLRPAWAIQQDLRKRYHDATKAKDSSALRRIEKEDPFPKKNKGREWAESIIFAVFAAHFIRLFLIEAYTIPTPSMEGSLLVGDFLFVSKIHYGSRMPMTPIAFPLVHNMLPFSTSRSYSSILQWDYRRGPRIQNVEPYDPVVFNYPEEDTSFGGIAADGRPLDYSKEYHNLLKEYPPEQRGRARQQILKTQGHRLVIRPVDKRSHYIKRCVGLPGDIIEMREGNLFVNNAPARPIAGVQYAHTYTIDPNVTANFRRIQEAYKVQFVSNSLLLGNPVEVQRMVQREPAVIRAERHTMGAGIYSPGTFPYNGALFPWNKDNYGPITIPAKGTPLELSVQNLDLYHRLITVYEGNELRVDGTTIYINGTATNTYTPKMDYYWMMGDNRDNSADSRAWGYVPEDHIVGKPLFVWLSFRNGSLKEGIRWDRIFTSAQGF